MRFSIFILLLVVSQNLLCQSINFSFIENKGQIIDQNNKVNHYVKFLFNSPGFKVQIRNSGFSYDVYNEKQIAVEQKLIPDSGTPIPHFSDSSMLSFHRIDFDFIGYNRYYTVETSEVSSSYLNYYTTGTPDNGVTLVKSYGRITYKNFYPGIDLIFHKEGNHFKYSFVIMPEGDIGSIKFRVTGTDPILNIDGSMQLQTEFGIIDEVIPESFFQNGSVRKITKVGFESCDKNTFKFSCIQKTKYQTLIIDPTPRRRWGTYFGGEQNEVINAIKTDGSIYLYFAGASASTNNIATTGAFQTICSGNEDGFITKFDSSGNIVWSTYYGGAQTDGFTSIAINGSFLYVTGSTKSLNNISTSGSYQQIFGGGQSDGIIEKFTIQGIRVWGSYYGGPGDDYIQSCYIADNKLYFIGNTSSQNNISSLNSFQPTHGGGFMDAFLVKFDSSGNRIWGTYYGGSGADNGNTCSILNDTMLFIGGLTQSSNNMTTPGCYQSSINGTADAFMARFDTAGQRKWGTYYGGMGVNNSQEWVSTCLTSPPDLVFFMGNTYSSDNIATPGAFQTIYGGSEDGFITKFDNEGNRLWGTYFGGSCIDVLKSGTIDDSSFLFIAGQTCSTNNIATLNTYQTSLVGPWDAFLAKFNNTGSIVWSTYYGGTNADDAHCVEIAGDAIYMGGITYSYDGIVAGNSYQTTYGGGPNDAFLVKFLDCANPPPALIISGPTDVCNNSNHSYIIPPVLFATGYQWNFPTGVSISSGQNTNTITLNFGPTAVSGYISVKGTNDCGVGDSSYIYVTVHQRPLPVITGNDLSCIQMSENYLTEAGKSNYQWTFSSGGQQISGGTVFDDFIQIKWINSGTQWVEVNYTDINNCSASAPAHFPVDVAVGNPVDISISESQNNVCAGTMVTFSATLVNPGSNPAYQWKVNGVNAGSNASTFTYVPTNGDIVTCILTSSNTVCTSNNPATSNSITMVVNPLQPVSVTVSPSANPVCSGTTVNFTALPVNGGSNPSWLWKVNGLVVGSNAPAYSYVPVNGDVVNCTLTSNVQCPSGNPAISGTVILAVSPNLPVGVSIVASSNPFCAGSSVTYTASPVNGGTIPAYQWKVNGINAGSNSPVLTYSPANWDVVTCSLVSSETCTSGNPAQSNPVTMVVNATLPAGITISASANPFCPGSAVTFTATPVNGGSIPVYQWKVNGTNAGTIASTFTYNPQNNDSVRCILTSNLNCVTGNPVSSAKIIMNGTLAPIVSFTSCFDTVTTVGAKAFKLKGGIPLGGTYSGPGVNGMTGIFTPSVAGTGLKTIQYTYTNVASCSASKSKAILVQPNPVFTCGNSFSDIRDGKSYPTVQIGTQCWMAANLNYGSILTSSQVQNDNCISEKYCYNNVTGNCTKYGGLYQWDEVMKYDDTPAGQGLCPPGWHVPTDSEWTTLFNFYQGNALAGKPLQDTILSGFKAQTSGVFYLNSSWSFNGFATLFWSSTPWSAVKAISHGMNIYDFSVSLYPSSKVNAFPIRCLKE